PRGFPPPGGPPVRGGQDGAPPDSDDPRRAAARGGARLVAHRRGAGAEEGINATQYVYPGVSRRSLGRPVCCGPSIGVEASAQPAVCRTTAYGGGDAPDALPTGGGPRY